MFGGDDARGLSGDDAQKLGDGDGSVGATDLAGHNDRRRSSSRRASGFLLSAGEEEEGGAVYIPAPL
jgi:hypothetical protein